MEKIKDDRIQIRINSKDKKILQKRAIDKELTLGEYILYACMREITESEITEIYKDEIKGKK